MTKGELHKKIEIMRYTLYDFIEKYGIESDIVLNISQELDKLLTQWEYMDYVNDTVS